MRIIGGLAKLLVASVMAGVLLAGLLLPYTLGAGLTVNRLTATIESTGSTTTDMSQMPQRTVIYDRNGAVDSDGNPSQPFAYIYEQNRVYVPLSQISELLRKAVISIEDRRFKIHPGVDWQGTLRALLQNMSGEPISGGSTITQQLVKNYRYLVQADTPAEKADAIARTPIRKLREAKLALRYETTHTKNQILEQYLNLIAFGPNTYGAEAASEHFFGIHASRLSLSQSALLAAMINNPNVYNPLDSSQIRLTLQRRNQVLDDMEQYGYITPEARDAAKARSIAQDLNARYLPNGCINSPQHATYGYFCRYVLDYLQDSGMTYDEIARGGYSITATLDPDVMASAVKAVKENSDPDAPAGERIANVLAIVEPGVSTRKVVALAANRPYGLNAEKGETVQRLTTTFAPLGAGDVFKVFTAATALEQGLGVQSFVPVPETYTSPLSPEFEFTNSKDRKYPESMSLEDALAQQPDTPFVHLEDKVGLANVVSTAVDLGMRGYTLESGDVARQWSGMGMTYAELITAQKISSFTLGVSPVSPLELANVGATLASDGMWCPPTPVASISDWQGKPVTWQKESCGQAVPPGLAHTLTNALTQSLTSKKGTGYPAAHAADWTGTAAGITGSRARHRSAAFLGYTPYYSGAAMTWDYLGSPEPLCVDPLRTCTLEEAQSGAGLTGGSVPEQSWLDALKPLRQGDADSPFPVSEARYLIGAESTQVPLVEGLSAADAKALLRAHGFTKFETEYETDTGMPANTVVTQSPKHSALPGTTVTLTVSAGQGTSSNSAPVDTSNLGGDTGGDSSSNGATGDGSSSGDDGSSSGDDGG